MALAALALMAAGCGSSAPSNGSFVAKADAICASFDAAGAKLSAPGTVAAIKREETRLSAMLTKLGVLSAPFDRGAPYSSFLYEFGQARPLLGQLAVATSAHDEARVRSLQAQIHRFQRNGQNSAVEVGLKDCA